jgi:hypothetical protein
MTVAREHVVFFPSVNKSFILTWEKIFGFMHTHKESEMTVAREHVVFSQV